MAAGDSRIFHDPAALPAGFPTVLAVPVFTHHTHTHCPKSPTFPISLRLYGIWKPFSVRKLCAGNHPLHSPEARSLCHCVAEAQVQELLSIGSEG